MALGGKAQIIGDLTRENIGEPVPVILPAPGVLFARRAAPQACATIGEP